MACSASNTDERGSPWSAPSAEATSQRISQSTPPKSRITASMPGEVMGRTGRSVGATLVASRGAGPGGRGLGLGGGDVPGQRHPAARLQALLVELAIARAGLLVVAEIRQRVGPGGLVPLLLGDGLAG